MDSRLQVMREETDQQEGGGRRNKKVTSSEDVAEVSIMVGPYVAG